MQTKGNTVQPTFPHQNSYLLNIPDPTAAMYQLPRPIQAKNQQVPYHPLQQGQQNNMSYANPTMLAGPSQGASGSQGPQGMDLRTAWENLARA